LPRLAPNNRGRSEIYEFLMGLPIRFGSPIAVSFLPDLTVSGSELLSAGERGKPVHAASFIRERKIILETRLLQKPRLLRLILVHELGHFVWARLGTRLRTEFEALIAAECAARARGEMGESAGVAKGCISSEDIEARTKRWREYVCESFCDTIALLYSGVSRSRFHTLGGRWRARREAWFRTAIHWNSRCF
jgi:hypothetical protein